MMKNLAPTKSLFELLKKETNGLCLDVVFEALLGINLREEDIFIYMEDLEKQIFKRTCEQVLEISFRIELWFKEN